MLLEFGAKNYYSFKEGFEISLRLNQSCPEEISKNKEFSNILCVKGANGSGKTNALRMLLFLKMFCCNSFNNKPDDEIAIESFYSNNEPTEFFIVFGIEGIEYTYEVQLTRKKILSEKLYKKAVRKTLLIDRAYDSFVYLHPQFKKLNVIKLRDNASLISTANQYEIVEIKEFYDFFRNIIQNVSSSGTSLWTPSLSVTSEFYSKLPDVFDFVKKVIYRCDLGINDINIEYREDEKGNKHYYPIFSHNVGDEAHTLHYSNESSGTRSLYLQLGAYHTALNNGGLLVLDEFDINIHPDILPLLIELFENEETNINDAQLIFTTHNADIMDKLSKYRIILTSKENNESFLYRLDEIPGDILRNDRPISPIYKSGKIGGIPKI